MMIWPLQSPDHNPVELLWDELDRQRVCLTSQEHLWEILQKAWSEISNSVLEKFVERMPRLVKKVLLREVGSTKRKCEF